jgi:single-strand DNA-binding protein
MSNGINKVLIIGNLGRSPETAYLQNGTAVTKFSVATSESWKDKETGEKQSRAEWHKIVTFNKLAEICATYLKKGSKVYIEGKLRTNKWEKDGQPHYTTEIVADNMQMLDSKADSQALQREAPQENKPTNVKEAKSEDGFDDFDDDLPF